MKWLKGFVLGTLLGFALGCFVAPMAGGRALSRLAEEPRMLPDERLTRRMWERMRQRGIDNPHIDVTTVDRVMYLRGRARDASEVATVVDLAETMPGVEQVVNELKVPESAQPVA